LLIQASFSLNVSVQLSPKRRILRVRIFLDAFRYLFADYFELLKDCWVFGFSDSFTQRRVFSRGYLFSAERASLGLLDLNGLPPFSMAVPSAFEVYVEPYAPAGT